MARQIITDDEFFAVPITSGTIQNIGTIPVELSNGTTPGEGIVLNQGESYQWDNTAIYVRKTRSGNVRAQIAYVPFKKSAGGGGSSSYVLPVASASVLGGVKSSNATGKISIDSAGVMTYNAPAAQPIVVPTWETGKTYAHDTLVENDDTAYMCLVAHTSTTFAADFAAGKWKVMGGSTLTLTKDNVAAAGCERSYTVKLDGVALAPKISMPKDYVLKNIIVKTVETDDVPYIGAEVGDKYADFVINTVHDGDGITEPDQHKYLPLASEYNLPISTKTVLGGVKSSNATGKISVDPVTGVMTYNEPNLSAPDWENGKDYAVNDMVEVDNKVYLSLVAHTSSPDFATDLNANKWVRVGADNITVAKAETAAAGYEATYTIALNGTALTPSINIPKDRELKSITLRTVETADVPYAGAKVGDKYADFVINTVHDGDGIAEPDQHKYLPMVGDYTLPIGTKTKLGGVKSSDAAGDISIDPDTGIMTYNVPESESITAPEWETNTVYAVNTIVEHSDDIYMCLVAHTSGTFAADLAAGKWKLISVALKVATASELGGVKSSNAEGKVAVDSEGIMSYNAPPLSAPAWEQETVYKAKQLAENSNKLYMCLVNHTSGLSFDTDLAGGKWAQVGYPTAVTVAQDATAAAGFQASYTLSVDGVAITPKINIPKDHVLKSVTTSIVTTADVPYIGAEVGDKYADFVINTIADGDGVSELDTHKYLPLPKYTLPIASASELGGVKVGDRLSIDANGVLSADEIPTASATELGGIKVGDRLSINAAGVLSADEPPMASAIMQGTVKVGEGLSIDAETGILSANSATIATTSTPGTVKANNADGGVSVDATGKMTINLPTASDTVKGGAKIGDGLSMDSETETLSLGIASDTDLGGVKVGAGLAIDENGVLDFKSFSNAAAHNAVYRGKDLTSYFTGGGFSTAIANGTFDDIYPGDYIIKSVTINGTTYSNVKWVVMDLDYFLYTGDTSLTTHHIVLMPENTLIVSTPMNDTNTAEGGYKGSKMWTTTIPLVDTGIETAFGSAHVLSHKELLSNAINADAVSAGFAGWKGAASAWEWLAVKSNIPNEPMVYGCHPCSSSLFDVGNAPTQLAAFKHNPTLRCAGRRWFWTRAVASSSGFAGASAHGNADYSDAALSTAYGGVRPYFLCR